MKKAFAAILLIGAAGILLFMGFRGESPGAGPWKPGRPFPLDRLKIGVIHVSHVTDETTSGYAYAHERGLKEMQRAMRLRDDQIIRIFNVSDTNEAATEYAIRKCIAEGAAIIVATSWNHMEACEKLAPEFPGVIFAHASGVRHNARNFTAYFGKVHQARYLAGLIAGLRTVTGRIGYVAAMGKENSEVTGGLDAFALGVEKVNPRARVLTLVTHRWYDPEGEALAARRLIAAGCDVLAQHSNTPAPQAEAQKAGIWGIGYNSDMSADAPGAVIASVVWNWGAYYKFLVKSVLDGTFTPEPYMGDLKDGLVDLTPINESLATPEIVAAVAAARKDITENGFEVFYGIMTADDGTEIGEKDKGLTEDYIRNHMNWYYRNVTALEGQ